jgi:hypothetical protein
MALPKKGSRQITVDGLAFRWSVRPKPTYAQGAYAAPMAFAVEAAQRPGRALHVELARARPDNWLEQPTSPVTPSEVEKFIRRALATGWNPGEPGPPLEITD